MRNYEGRIRCDGQGDGCDRKHLSIEGLTFWGGACVELRKSPQFWRVYLHRSLRFTVNRSQRLIQRVKFTIIQYRYPSVTCFVKFVSFRLPGTFLSWIDRQDPQNPPGLIDVETIPSVPYRRASSAAKTTFPWNRPNKMGCRSNEIYAIPICFDYTGSPESAVF
jgi:hypothetical protein